MFFAFAVLEQWCRQMSKIVPAQGERPRRAPIEAVWPA
jgi:hypothetical protein